MILRSRLTTLDGPNATLIFVGHSRIFLLKLSDESGEGSLNYPFLVNQT